MCVPHLLEKVHDGAPLAIVCALQPLSQAILAAELHLNKQVGWGLCWLHNICEGGCVLKTKVWLVFICPTLSAEVVTV